jgi:outer membrane protein assembly factor BamB
VVVPGPFIILVGSSILALTVGLAADDWPEWRGRGRTGEWSESGILTAFPDEGLQIRWRVPIGSGYAGPAVASGRVFVTDASRIKANRYTERILCLDELTGTVLWSHSWEADYTGLQVLYAIGPRATPTVNRDLVHVVGAVGHLWTLDAATGRVIWQKDYVREYQTTLPVWGIAAAPVVDGPRLIALVGGEPDAKVVAFDAATGREVWRALSSDWEPGYNQPIITEVDGLRQLIIWDPRAVQALDPATGRVYWEEPFDVTMGMNVATPVVAGDLLLVTAFYNGARLYRMGTDRRPAELLWKANGRSEIDTDTIHSTIGTPIFDGTHVYGLDSYGQMRCLDARTGERLWETLAVTGEKARHATAFFVRHGDRVFINNDKGELIIATLSPKGFTEIDRTTLIVPTSKTANRRSAGAVNWSHPAYANRHIVARNDQEILRASLEGR